MKRWQLVFLLFELALFAIILVLPQVALPDFTFHGGTAPVAAHSRICHSTPGTAIAAVPQALAPIGPLTMRAKSSAIFLHRLFSPVFRGCVF